MYEHSAVNDSALYGVAVDGSTLIRIWSMSKIVTISIIMDLVENNTISLDDPVSNYIPEFKHLEVAQSPDGELSQPLERAAHLVLQWIQELNLPVH